MIPAIIAPALLLAAIAGAGALLGAAVIWARNRQRRRAQMTGVSGQKLDEGGKAA